MARALFGVSLFQCLDYFALVGVIHTVINHKLAYWGRWQT